MSTKSPSTKAFFLSVCAVCVNVHRLDNYTNLLNEFANCSNQGSKISDYSFEWFWTLCLRVLSPWLPVSNPLPGSLLLFLNSHSPFFKLQTVAGSFQWGWMLWRIGRGWRVWGVIQRGANECHCNAVRGGAKNTYWHMDSDSQTGSQTHTRADDRRRLIQAPTHIKIHGHTSQLLNTLIWWSYKQLDKAYFCDCVHIATMRILHRSVIQRWQQVTFTLWCTY